MQYILGYISDSRSCAGPSRSRTQGPPPPSPVAEAAVQRGIPQETILTPEKAKDEAFLQALRVRCRRGCVERGVLGVKL